MGDLTVELGSALLGSAARDNPPGRFPLLIKLIDATQQLSIQVHPNDQQAQELEQEPFGKTEAWYILDAEEDAKLVYGLARPLSQAQLRERAAEGSIEQDLAYLPVAPGDVVLVPAGTIHAIGAGIVLYEIQQTSNTTYRLYDWNRRGPDGQPRELHLDKGVQVAMRTPTRQGKQPPRELGRQGGAVLSEAVRCPYFVLEHAVLDGPWLHRQEGTSFLGVSCVAGGVTLRSPEGDWPDEELGTGHSALVPAGLAACNLLPSTSEAELLLARLP
jgi:mannose-6-phosphate isomerase